MKGEEREGGEKRNRKGGLMLWVLEGNLVAPSHEKKEVEEEAKR